jgi:hypothetical protein
LNGLSNFRRKAFSLVALVLILTVSTLYVMPGNAQVDPTISVDPLTYTAVRLNEVFDVNIDVENVEGSLKVVAAEFKLGFDEALLEVVDVTEGPFFDAFAGAPHQGTFFVLLETDSYVHVGILILPDSNGTYYEPFPNGNGTLATIRFRAIHRPEWPSPNASCTLELYDTKLADETGDLPGISHTTQDGNYEIVAIPPPTIEVTPQLVTATHRGDKICVNVNVVDLDADWRTVGFEFKLGFNSTLLEFANFTEGTFLNSFGETYAVHMANPEYVLVGLLLLPQQNGSWTLFPEGSGTLATICCNVTHGPAVSDNLLLYDVKMANVTGSPPGIPSTRMPGRYEFMVEYLTHQIAWNGYLFEVFTASNSTLSPATFEVGEYLTFTTLGAKGTNGFIRVSIPRQLMDGTFSVLVDGIPVPLAHWQNSTYNTLYFVYPQGGQNDITILATTVIPEFTTLLLPLLFLLATLAVISAKKRGRPSSRP